MKQLLCMAVHVALLMPMAAGAVSALAPGDYLEDAFAADLRVTRSPNDSIRKGMDDGAAQSINLAPSKQGMVFKANWNWHEGAVLFTLHADGGIEEGEGWRGGGFDPPPGLDEDAPGHFSLRYKSKTLGYSFVGSADKAIAQIVLVGRYADRNRHVVTFGSDGWLHAPGLNDPFTLQNDHVTNPYDFFLLGRGEPRVIAFRWKDGQLTLYPTGRPDPGVPFLGMPNYAHPLMVLRPIAGPP